ncbi:type IV pilus assembly protein PilW [Pseudomonas delhiensis]|uniref:Type IV pilus assembly protein PilW n=1 Tax=Pseudomonas delhiensis TaxID=366289 RepID=A0A239HPX7_9PSED|nr:PilW family protein [Pseudomonas delhiensis]SDI48311.1 type IV pilus assembly protein PilW [Pseudomonas delhiensis]SNS82993.1 type IV pilus assembly protein PilW [Pseudomonas delhiensis]
MQKRQQGLSLIELMVALTVSSFLIIGIVQIFIDNKNTFVFQQAQTENQENSRYTFLLLDQELSKTGYRRQPDRGFDTSFPAVTSQSTPAPPAGCSFLEGRTVSLANGGGICIRYEPRDPDERNCLGAKPADGTVPDEPYTTSTLTVMERFYVDDNELKCAVGGDEEVILRGVADIQFEYGVGPQTDERQVDTYTTDPGTQPIRAVRYAALMMSSVNARQGMDSATLTQWKARYPDSSIGTDNGQLYQIAQGSITLRNLMP